MTTLTQTIDSTTGKVLRQVFHCNGKSKLLYKVENYAKIASLAWRTHDTVRITSRRGRKMIVYNIYLAVAH